MICRDDDAKYREVKCADGSKAIITIAGYKKRMNSVLSYLEKEEIENFDKLVDLIKMFFINYPEEDKDSACQFHVAGFSIAKKVYMVYRIGDFMEYPKIKSFDVSHPNFSAIGSGGSFGLETLKKHKANSGMKYKEALDCINECLVNACMKSIHCGGDLNVLWIRNQGRHYDHQVKHCIDALLDENFPFQPYSIFFFSCEEEENMNYAILSECLVRKTMSIPRCLGKVFGDWNLFVAVFDKENQERVLSKGTSMEAYRESIHMVSLADFFGNSHNLLMSPAEHDILRDIRKNGFLKKILFDILVVNGFIWHFQPGNTYSGINLETE